MFFDYPKNLAQSKENKTNYANDNTFETLFKIPSADNYMELCQILMDKEEKKEYVNPLFDTYNYGCTNTTGYSENINSAQRQSVYSGEMIFTNPNETPFHSNYIVNQPQPEQYHQYNRVKMNKEDKPDDSYAYMILRALSSSKCNMMTLNEIYKWIENNYSYFKTADAIWKNSIRHNLSLNGAFKKTPRQANQKGKGGYWSIVDDKNLVNKINRKRRITRSYSQQDYSSKCNGYYDHLNNSF